MQLTQFEEVERTRLQTESERRLAEQRKRASEQEEQLRQTQEEAEARQRARLAELRSELAARHEREQRKLSEELERANKLELDKKNIELATKKERASAVSDLEKQVRALRTSALLVFLNTQSRVQLVDPIIRLLEYQSPENEPLSVHCSHRTVYCTVCVLIHCCQLLFVSLLSITALNTHCRAFRYQLYHSVHCLYSTLCTSTRVIS